MTDNDDTLDGEDTPEDGALSDLVKKNLHYYLSAKMDEILAAFTGDMDICIVVYSKDPAVSGALLVSDTPEKAVEAIKYMAQNAPREELGSADIANFIKLDS